MDKSPLLGGGTIVKLSTQGAADLDTFMELYPVSCGRFAGLETRLEGDTSGLSVRCKVSRRFAKALAGRISLTHDSEPCGRIPLLVSYEDAASGQNNAVLTSGGIGTLNGRRAGCTAWRCVPGLNASKTCAPANCPAPSPVPYPDGALPHKSQNRPNFLLAAAAGGGCIVSDKIF